MRTAIVTGAFGFAGANLVEQLLESNYVVYAIGREGSLHNDRFQSAQNLKTRFIDMEDYDKIPNLIDEEDIKDKEVIFFHLSWGGGRDDFDSQVKNIDGSLKAMDSAISFADKGNKVVFVGIGSQAEYGVKDDSKELDENALLEPFSAYGAAKAAAFHLIKNKAKKAEIHFVWGRIFSLIGKYEPEGRMLPDLVRKLKRGEEVYLSSCRQYWDYLDAKDAAKAIMLLGEKGRDGEVYNIASGNYKELKVFVKEAAKYIGADEKLLHFGKDPEPYVSFKPMVKKLMEDTGWKVESSFFDSIDCYDQNVR
ncbi:NAD-dependent epimerase/dehydratase family protein [Butyrivibrio proteoclasticus]|nr:NAD(P)-dependent oxidoreductase [Butyrivibrio proteoclasticus]